MLLWVFRGCGKDASLERGLPFLHVCGYCLQKGELWFKHRGELLEMLGESKGGDVREAHKVKVLRKSRVSIEESKGGSSLENDMIKNVEMAKCGQDRFLELLLKEVLWVTVCLGAFSEDIVPQHLNHLINLTNLLII